MLGRLPQQNSGGLSVGSSLLRPPLPCSGSSLPLVNAVTPSTSGRNVHWHSLATLPQLHRPAASLAAAAASSSGLPSPHSLSIGSRSIASVAGHGSSRQQQQQHSSERLQSIPGLGPKTEEKLRKGGITSVSSLVKLHIQSKPNFKALLAGHFGLKNKTQVAGIISYLNTLEQAGGASTSGTHALSLPKITISIEGNISAGKSTFLNVLDMHMKMGVNDMRFVPEPIDKWQNVKLDNGESFNLLMDFYCKAVPAYHFQNYVFLTRVMAERDTYNDFNVARLLERSVFSDRMVFVRAMSTTQDMTPKEFALYDSWFGPILNCLPTLRPNGFIYLRAQPETCYQRLKKRNRDEETAVGLDYLQELHRRHEDWLKDAGVLASSLQQRMGGGRVTREAAPWSAAPATVLPLESAPPLGLDQVVIPASLQNSLTFIDATRMNDPIMLKHLHQVPALVLECDRDVDWRQDLEYGRHVSTQVADYVTFLQQYTIASTRAKAWQQGNDYYQMDSQGSVHYLHNASANGNGVSHGAGHGSSNGVGSGSSRNASGNGTFGRTVPDAEPEPQLLVSRGW